MAACSSSFSGCAAGRPPVQLGVVNNRLRWAQGAHVIPLPPLHYKRQKRVYPCARTGNDDSDERARQKREQILQQQADLASRIASGEFTVGTKRADRSAGARQALAQSGASGRAVAKSLASLERWWRRRTPLDMPTAQGDVRAIVGQPFFVPLYNLFRVYGGVFRLSFGPKQFAIVSDPRVAQHILKDNAKAYSKGILAEILEFVMGTGLIPADGEVWKVRRRAIVPALHKQYVAAMVKLFGDCALRLCDKLETVAAAGGSAEMEQLFSRVTLDVIGKAVFNYDFDSLSRDTGIIEAVYVTLREAEVRSTSLLPLWKVPLLRQLLPRQREVDRALVVINEALDQLVERCKSLVEEEETSFSEEYVSKREPSILSFLLASGEEVSSKQLRDDLMTMLIAGHETSAAVLTWTFYLLAQNPEVTARLEEEVDAVLGDRMPAMEDMKRLTLTTRVINEGMRLYPQPPVLIRRAMEDDIIGGFPIPKGQDIFISVWNLHRDPKSWERAEEFLPDRWATEGLDPNNFKYLPFGGGPRKCVGDVFATYEVGGDQLICTVAVLVRRFRFRMAANAPPVEMTTGATIHTTKGLLMEMSRRGGAQVGAARELASTTAGAL